MGISRSLTAEGRRREREALRAGRIPPRTLEMRRLWYAGYTQTEIAKKLHANQATVCRNLALSEWGGGVPTDTPKVYGKKKTARGNEPPRAVKGSDRVSDATRT